MKPFFKYLLFIYVLAISGFEYFFRTSSSAVYFLFPIVVVLFLLLNIKFDRKVLFVFLPFFSVFLLQTILYNSPWHYAFTLLIRLFVYYLVIKLIGTDLINIFIKTIKVIALSSLVFYSLEHIHFFQNSMLQFSTYFTNLSSVVSIAEAKPNFIIYTLQTDYNYSYIRNAGPFFEPGFFAIFLNIALFLNSYIKKKLFDKTNVFFIICILTTVSTAGYIALIANIGFFVIGNKHVSIFNRIAILLLILMSIPAISSLSFMKEKISNQIEDSDVSYSRVGAAVVHWEIIQDYPITGMPYDEATINKYSATVSPNGITEIFTRYGVIAGLIYYYFLFVAAAYIMRKIGYKNKGYLLFIIFVLVIFGETAGNKPIYWIFIFLPYSEVFKNKIDRVMFST